jgi:hypothetical protein
MSHTKQTVGLVALAAVLALLALGTATASATEYYEWKDFCVGNRTSHGSCEGPRSYPTAAVNKSTNGGWSWVWVWNENWGADTNSCQSGNCTARAEVGGRGYGKEQMSNIAGGTYYFVPEYLTYIGESP